MANTPLTGNSISTSYQGLLKAGDSGAIGATEKPITDGLANASTLSLGTTSASFTGTLDLSGATVTGLPAGAAGLESGTGTDSMQSAASLTTTPADAAGANSINLGNNSTSNSSGSGQIGIGNNSNAFGLNAISIGTSATNTGGNSTVIGPSAVSGFGQGAVALGQSANASAGSFTASVAIGKSSVADQNGVAIGNASSSTVSNGVALGAGVTNTIADTVSVKALETQTNSTPTAGGIIMSDAGGTDRRINIDASGALQIDSTPVGGGGGEVTPYNGTTSFRGDNNTARYFMRATYLPRSFSFSTTSLGANILYYIPIQIAEGESFNEITINVRTASTAGSMRLGLYKSGLDASGHVQADALVSDFGTVSTATTGRKTISSLGITIPSGAIDSTYYIAFVVDETCQIAASSNSDLAYYTVPRVYSNDLGDSIATRLGVFTQSFTYAALPSTGAISGNSPIFPVIGFGA